jgi:hypothetical protein
MPEEAMVRPEVRRLMPVRGDPIDELVTATCRLIFTNLAWGREGVTYAAITSWARVPSARRTS